MRLDKIIGMGNKAIVYKENNYAIKLFNEHSSKKEVFLEALINILVLEKGIPVPEVYEVVNINNQIGITMENIEGISFIDYLLKDISNIKRKIIAMINLQRKIHKVEIDLPILLKEKMKNKILSEERIDKENKKRLLELLESLPKGKNLCHGDFHGYNILVKDEKLYAIDWADASIGEGYADICRTYLIYLLNEEKLAKLYLEIYSKIEGIEKREVLKWLPIVAATRLSENIEGEEKKLFELITI